MINLPIPLMVGVVAACSDGVSFSLGVLPNIKILALK
jgi:hypothetical protein